MPIPAPLLGPCRILRPISNRSLRWSRMLTRLPASRSNSASRIALSCGSPHRRFYGASSVRPATHQESNSIASLKESKKSKNKGLQESSILPYVEETPCGEKKILRPLEGPYRDAYNPTYVESAWYDWWQKEGLFKPEYAGGPQTSTKEPFVIVVPPPNVTGKLHIGHGLALALQDTLIRWNRMRGAKTLFLPGCDHAGIGTQSVVEKQLWKREGKTRHDLGRKNFVSKIWEWKGEYHESITNAMKRMGGSFDWSREAFTMDENLSAAVTETFVRLHKEGLIYRDKRIVRWCTALRTVLSDSEVAELKLEGRKLLSVPGYEKKVEFGVLVHFKYPVDGTNESIEVATTRPETIPGDTGIAVHPEDKRYGHLIGKFVRHPFVDRLLPIVADEGVDPEFGTGAVKITPAHDYEDEQRGKRHNLETIDILNDDGTLNQNAGPFAGYKRFDVRYQILEQLDKLGLFVKKEDNSMTLKICPKSGDIIEPLIKPQWFIKISGMAKAAIEAVSSGQIKIQPPYALKQYMDGLDKMEDWCISRQLWWGHQAPAYLIVREGQDEEICSADNDLWIIAKTEEEAQKIAEKKLAGESYRLVRDPDVLDTWFSSALWPFSTLGWPNKTADLATYYPTSVLETGWDILGIWVSRMIMLGLKLTGSVPFREVYCHGLVRDAQGRKMSKSLGNVIDPVDVIEGITLQDMQKSLQSGNLDPSELSKATKNQKAEFPKGIPQCGTDALRLSLNQSATGGLDVVCDIGQMDYNRRFCNKLFQATKYFLSKMDDGFSPAQAAAGGRPSSLPSRWILHRLNQAAKSVDEALQDRDFSEAATVAHDFFKHDLCDVYIENSKHLLSPSDSHTRNETLSSLYVTLESGLKLLHPFMPYVTEELWQRLPRRPNDSTPSIVVALFPEFAPAAVDAEAEDSYQLVLAFAKSIRVLAENYPTSSADDFFIETHDQATYDTIISNSTNIKALLPSRIAQINTAHILPPHQSSTSTGIRSSISAVATVYLAIQKNTDYSEVLKRLQKKQKKAVEKLSKRAEVFADADEFAKGSERWQVAAIGALAEAKEELSDLESNIELLSQLPK